MTIKKTIRTLRDVDGVGGSFLLGLEGALVSHDMPTYFDLQSLRDVGPRVVRLLDVWAAGRSGVDCSLRFAEGRLYLRRFDGAVLCVLLAGQVQMAALRAAVRLVVSQLARYRDPVAPAPAQLPADIVPERAGASRTSSAPAARTESSAPGIRPRGRVRVYRGQRYDDVAD